MNEKRISVAVVGAGMAGLAAIKEFVGQGFDVVAFEKYDDIGGIWRYQENPEYLSVASNTVTNSSKYLVPAFCYSDFPMPKDFPPYLTHNKFKEYLDTYCQHFDLKKHIKFRHEIIKVEQVEDRDQWQITTKSDTGVDTWFFDKLVMATGRYQIPQWPHVENLDKFEGELIHASRYKRPEPYHGKTVLVVGNGNSGVDSAVELSNGIAKKVYISGRPIYVLPRLGLNGRPLDLLFTRSLKSPALLNNAVKNVSKTFYGDLKQFGLGGAPDPIVAPISINSHFVEALNTGGIIARPKLVKIIGPNAVQFQDGTTLDGIDVIIMATGYRADYSYLSSQKYSGKESAESKKVGLYKSLISPEAPYSLAFINQVLTASLSPTTSELQSRYLAQIYKGNIQLPSYSEMKKEIEEHQQFIAATKYNKDDVSMVKLGPYMDWLAKQIGCDVRSRLTWWLWFRNRKLYNCVANGVFSGHQFRIWGPGSWDGAVDALIKVNEVP